ncbi:hypothetical protein DENIS_2721 [Desulfonema ishimotonii]|uniref:Uncharacterized protein n=1 Tax=Desulfonema ishimotonii TaxID=45657 RepID=A0A401FXT5_9BACT|nr:hypothetical protein [Desulfonema ishimotonii]GBC61759.1 hypothetical protein DENIS_2721 [Desulfonema ishimotonii]
MGVFKEETETKRVIFNVRLDLAQRLEAAKKEARSFGKKLDVDGSIDIALEKFLKKAEKKIAEMKKKKGNAEPLIIGGSSDGSGPEPAETEEA